MWAIRYSPPAYVRRVRVVRKKRAQNRKIHYATPLPPQRKKLVRKVSIKPTYLRVETPIETNPMSSSPLGMCGIVSVAQHCTTTL